MMRSGAPESGTARIRIRVYVRVRTRARADDIFIWYLSWIYYMPPGHNKKLDPVLLYRGVGTDVDTQHEKRIRNDEYRFH